LKAGEMALRGGCVPVPVPETQSLAGDKGDDGTLGTGNK
jgi:hypothetical protein